MHRLHVVKENPQPCSGKTPSQTNQFLGKCPSRLAYCVSFPSQHWPGVGVEVEVEVEGRDGAGKANHSVVLAEDSGTFFQVADDEETAAGGSGDAVADLVRCTHPPATLLVVCIPVLFWGIGFGSGPSLGLPVEIVEDLEWVREASAVVRCGEGR